MEGRHIDAWVERALLERIDLLIINKFGREEAHGRGLRPVITEALIAEIPLLIGVSTRNLCDFLTFVGDSVKRLRPDIEAITCFFPAKLIDDQQIDTFKHRTLDPCVYAPPLHRFVSSISL